MNKFKLAACGVLGALALGSAMTLPTFAVTCPAGSQRTSANTLAECNVPENADGSSSEQGLVNAVKPIIYFVIGIAGVIAVVVIIVAGVNIAVSQGDSAKVSKATKAIIFSVIGLIICLLAFAIINFVLKGISATPTP